jgi:LmbE family N-acetylglucosaminyl deacetylase
LSISFAPREVETVLCLGAHCDDIEIGCAGALMVLAERFPHAVFHWVVFSADGQRERETRAAAARVFSPPTICHVQVQHFRGSYLPYEGAAVKDALEAVKARVPNPSLIFTHWLEDRHQDHRLIAELTWNTFRDHSVLEYEIPKFEGDLGHPNVFVPFGSTVAERKTSMLMECFPSQRGRSWFTSDLFMGLMRLRGVECVSPGSYAEAFHGRKLIL